VHSDVKRMETKVLISTYDFDDLVRDCSIRELTPINTCLVEQWTPYPPFERPHVKRASLFRHVATSRGELGECVQQVVEDNEGISSIDLRLPERVNDSRGMFLHASLLPCRCRRKSAMRKQSQLRLIPIICDCRTERGG
jgi:hypothetical protein